MKSVLLTNCEIINRGRKILGSVLIKGDEIAGVYRADEALPSADEVIDLHGAYLMPGAIDTHVHFREPGLTDKGSIASESLAAVAGGVTSYIDMPNTIPPTVTAEQWQEKMALAQQHSLANYAFFIGASADNTDAILKMDYTRVAGIKLFLGSTTGDMMVEDDSVARKLLRNAPCVIAVHAESERVIRENLKRFNPNGLDDLPVEFHSRIRDMKACFESSEMIVEMARHEDALLHLAHVSTAGELALLQRGSALSKRVTAETCPQYLLLSDADWASKGSRMKCNPAVKGLLDQMALRAAVIDNRIDSIATDHAPHLLSDKEGGALKAKSGMPMVQFSVIKMLDIFDPEVVVDKMCHNPARIFGVVGRGFIDAGCKADLVAVRKLDSPVTITDSDVKSKCGWTPLAGTETSHRVELTMVNGQVVYDHKNGVSAQRNSEALRFNIDRR